MKKEAPPTEDVESEYEIVENKGEEQGTNHLYPSPYPEQFIPSVIPGYPPASPVVNKEITITHALQDIPFRLSKQFTGADYTMTLIKAKEILMYINRSADTSYQCKYDFDVEKSVMNERTE